MWMTIAIIILFLIVGILLAIPISRKINGSNISSKKKDVIVNQGINVATGQLGSNQDKYFKGVGNEVINTTLLGQDSPFQNMSQGAYTQIIFKNMENGCTFTSDLLSYIDIGRGVYKEAEFLHVSENMMVSGKHCRILRINDGVYLEDLQSKNFTYLNDERVFQRVRVNSGDIISLGPEKFQVTFY